MLKKNDIQIDDLAKDAFSAQSNAQDAGSFILGFVAGFKASCSGDSLANVNFRKTKFRVVSQQDEGFTTLDTFDSYEDAESYAKIMPNTKESDTHNSPIIWIQKVFV